MIETGPLAKLHPSDWNFRFRSGRLCLDFIATIGDREHMAFDRWRGEADFSRWCMEAGLTATAIAVSGDELGAARRLREALYRLMIAALSRTAPDRADLRMVNEAAMKPALVPQLIGIGRAYAWTSEEPFDAVLATISRDAIDLLSSNAMARVRKCADSHCSILFLDTSRPGKRRWCAMNGCGNKVKKAAYRKRQRA
jgi:predicted RNA-binding Zn ribbon-like protein